MGKHMKSVTAAAIILLGTAATAVAGTAKQPAHDWYLINTNTVQCVKPQTMGLSTPEKLHLDLRDAGVVDTIKIDRDDAGGINYVEIIRPDWNNAIIYWFPTKALCEAGLEIGKEKGAFPNDPSDLN